MTNDKTWVMISVGSRRSAGQCRDLTRRGFFRWMSAAATSVSASFNVASSSMFTEEEAVV